MMREHNRIARALKLLNPLWTEEVLFQETRRIVIAELHHITYTEYLPAMLGKHCRLLFHKSIGVHKVGDRTPYKYEPFRPNRRTGHEGLQLKSSRRGYFRYVRRNNCRRSVDLERIRCFSLPCWTFPSPGNFSVISELNYLNNYWVSLRLLPCRLYNASDVQDQTFTLSSYFFDASKLPEPGFIDSAIRGLTKQMPLAVNAEYTSQLTNYLFK
jgi:peroxidase